MLKFSRLLHPDLQPLLESGWQQLKEGSTQPGHAFHTLIAANIAAEGINAYTVVLREINPDSGEVIFYTDVRSEKVAELDGNNRLTALFYDAAQQRQLIVKGNASLDRQNDLSRQHWQKGGYKGRSSYLAGQPPSTPVSEATDGLTYLQGQKFADDDPAGYQNFAVVTLKAHTFEYLQLSRDPGNRRARFRLIAGEWEGSWVIP